MRICFLFVFMNGITRTWGSASDLESPSSFSSLWRHCDVQYQRGSIWSAGRCCQLLGRFIDCPQCFFHMFFPSRSDKLQRRPNNLKNSKLNFTHFRVSISQFRKTFFYIAFQLFSWKLGYQAGKNNFTHTTILPLVVLASVASAKRNTVGIRKSTVQHILLFVYKQSAYCRPCVLYCFLKDSGRKAGS
jgi:hypothetical protein